MTTATDSLAPSQTVTLPIEGVRRNAASMTGFALPTERSAGLMVLIALAAIWLLRRLFRGGALGA